jgi:hypothetical protein
MGHEEPVVAIARLRSAWDEEVRPSVRRALFALSFAILFGGAHLARLGSPLARGIAAFALAATLIGFVLRAILLARRRRDLRRAVRDTIFKMDPDLGAATLRALTLVERTAVDENVGSPALAGLHLTRLLGRAPIDKVTQRAARAGDRWSRAGLACGLLAILAVVIEPFRIIEGLDVLAARAGEAPLSLAWVEDVEMIAIPPEYLHQPSSEIEPFLPASAPRGTTLTVRGRPLHAGRAVVLTDGKEDVRFVDDGAGGLVARWTLGDTTSLWVAANFGGVRIRQVDAQPVTSIADARPVVIVEGAPRTVRLLDEPSIPIHYQATDDHGLREINLVLRAGTREERRVLARPAADVTTDRGGYELKSNDPFFKRIYTPVEVTVEARDNDAVAGPKWGKSASILVILPQVGEPEALRYEALVKARDAVTDLVAFRLTDTVGAKEIPAKKAGALPVPTATPAPAQNPQEHLKREVDAQAPAVKAIEGALSGSYGGLTVRGRLVPLVRGQLRRIERALAAERKSPTKENHQKLLDETEEALLAVDAGVRSLGVRDTRTVAKRLADVADEAALAAAAGQGVERTVAMGGSGAPEKAGGPILPAVQARLDAAVQVLDGGGTQLLRLGQLGLDLGEIVKNDLRRIARAREAKDLFHAELAARDLAARLRRPAPSFMGGGGQRGAGGVESGGSPSAGGGEPSSADDEAAQASREIEELARDHAAQMDEVEGALERAASPEEINALKEEAKKHADAIREAIKQLPSQGGEPGSAESAAAAGREQAESMAGALENAKMREAVESGKRASQSLAEAKRTGDQSRGFFPEERAGREAEKARETIERELAFAEDALAKLRRASGERAKGDLAEAGKGEQRLADRAGELGKKGEKGDRSLPQEMLDRLSEAEQAMRDAERALREGDGESGLRQQQDAQRLLEMTRDQHAEENEREATKDGGKNPTGKTPIPGKDSGKTADQFRRRVLEGLGGSSDPLLREAVKRYAEGLLK